MICNVSLTHIWLKIIGSLVFIRRLDYVVNDPVVNKTCILHKKNLPFINIIGYWLQVSCERA